MTATTSQERVGLTVGALPGGSTRLGYFAMNQAEIPAGRCIRVRNQGRTIYGRKCWLMSGTQPAGEEIWIDEWQREDLGIALGDQVHITEVLPDEIPALTEVDLVVPVELGPVARDALAGFMAQKQFPLYRGFRFEFAPLGGANPLVVHVEGGRTGQHPTEPGRATSSTVVKLRVGGSGPATEISYDDIGGLAMQVQSLREVVELPIRMREVLRRLGTSAPRGVILHGPPGSGKTLLARALAHGSRLPIVCLGVAEVLARPPREVEERLASLFDEAEGHANGCIILIEDLDVLAPKDTGAGHGVGPGFAKVLISRLDAMKSRDDVVVIASTNQIDAIEPSLRRHGRFGREIHIAAPDEAGRAQILGVHTRRMPIDAPDEASRDRLLREVARRTRGFVGADLMELCREAGLMALRRTHPLERIDRGDFILDGPILVTASDFSDGLTAIRPSAMKEWTVTTPEISFTDIAGLDEIVQEVQQRVLTPLKHPDVFAEMGLSVDRGILFHGPPGSGKTMLAKAIAHECGANFLVVQGPELLSKWVGESEEGVRRVFAKARELTQTIVFFDEIEALLPVRGSHPGDSGVSDRVVNQFLAELDGVVEIRNITIIGATNRPELIDPAVLRPGRLGTHIRVPLPNMVGRAAILRLLLKDRFPDEALRRLAGEMDGYSGAELTGICQDAKRTALSEVNYAYAVEITEDHLRRSLTQYRSRHVSNSI